MRPMHGGLDDLALLICLRIHRDTLKHERYQRITEAYTVLKNPALRKVYDESLHGYGQATIKSSLACLSQSIPSLIGRTC